MKQLSIFITLFILASVHNFAQTTLEIPPEGGGEYLPQPTECLSEEARSLIRIELQNSLHNLEGKGLLTPADERAIVQFDWPLRPAAGFNWNSYYGISNYVDQDATAGLLDYNCGARVYNGHKGTDIFLWPFEWYQVNNDLVEAVAAEAGIIIAKTDGYEDDHCSCVNYLWNVVYVRHADGSVAYYGHLKKGSLTVKNVGQSVAKGEYLGVVASSGCSTGPHLHFEVYENPSQTKLIDPYFVANGCNNLNTVTWWDYQRPYRESTLNVNLTHDGVPLFGCPTPNEATFFKNQFNPGEKAYFATYYHDQFAGQVSYLKILMPNYTVWKSWSHTAPSTYSASYWYWSHVLPLDAPQGMWTWQVTYEGETFDHKFAVGNVTGTSQEDAALALSFYPVPVHDVLYVEFKETDAWRSASLALSDARGRQEMELPMPAAKMAFDLSALSAGVYFVSGTVAGKQVRRRLVKF
jgi:murein DD-endopeptidase MepM/ murein hydrolase activator NlpD